MSEEIHLVTTHDEGNPIAETVQKFQEAAKIDKAGEATHALLRLMSNAGTSTFEAGPTGVHFGDWSRVRGQKIHEYRFTNCSVARQQAAFYLLEKAWGNKSYAYGQLLSVGVWCLGRALGLKSRLISCALATCSELAWDYVQFLGGEEFESLEHYQPDENLFFPPHLLSWMSFTPLMERIV